MKTINNRKQSEFLIKLQPSTVQKITQPKNHRRLSSPHPLDIHIAVFACNLSCAFYSQHTGRPSHQLPAVLRHHKNIRNTSEAREEPDGPEEAPNHPPCLCVPYHPSSLPERAASSLIVGIARSRSRMRSGGCRVRTYKSLWSLVDEEFWRGFHLAGSVFWFVIVFVRLTNFY